MHLVCQFPFPPAPFLNLRANFHQIGEQLVSLEIWHCYGFCEGQAPMQGTVAGSTNKARKNGSKLLRHQTQEYEAFTGSYRKERFSVPAPAHIPHFITITFQPFMCLAPSHLSDCASPVGILGRSDFCVHRESA